MDRRGVAVGVGAAGTLLLAAWVSAAAPVGVFARSTFSGVEAKVPGGDFSAVSAPAATARGGQRGDVRTSDPVLVSVITVAMKLVLAAVVAIVLVALARFLLDRWRNRGVTAEDQVAEVDVVPEVLLEGALEGERLLARGTPGNAVIAAWVALEDVIRAAGIRDDDSRTAADLVTAVLRSHRVDRAPLDTLAALYREARFSRHPIGEEQRTTAREALVHVQADLRRTMARLAREGAGSR